MFMGFMLNSKEIVLTEMIQPVVEGLNYHYWGLEYLANGKHSILRVYIDAEQGITVEDCATVSRQVSAVMDVEDPIAGQYTLEVSSPGVDRPLFTEAQFNHYRGHIVELRLHQAFEGRRNFKGQLNGVEDGDLKLIIDTEEYLLPLEEVDKARLVPVFED